MSKKAPTHTVLSILPDFDGTRLVSLQDNADADTTKTVRLAADESPDLAVGDGFTPEA